MTTVPTPASSRRRPLMGSPRDREWGGRARGRSRRRRVAALNGVRPLVAPLVWTGRLVVAGDVIGLTYAPTTDERRTLPSPPAGPATTGNTALWTGDPIVWWGGSTYGTASGPGRPVAGGIALRPGG